MACFEQERLLLHKQLNWPLIKQTRIRASKQNYPQKELRDLMPVLIRNSKVLHFEEFFDWSESRVLYAYEVQPFKKPSAEPLFVVINMFEGSCYGCLLEWFEDFGAWIHEVVNRAYFASSAADAIDYTKQEVARLRGKRDYNPDFSVEHE